MKTRWSWRFFLPVFAVAFGLPVAARAQCTLAAQATVVQHSECAASGIIEVNVSGGAAVDMANIFIDLTNFAGVNQSVTANSYTFNDLPQGTYRVIARALCPPAQEVSDTTYVTVNSSYIGTTMYATAQRYSLNCRGTGMLSMMILNGRPPYTVEATTVPPGYTGQTVWPDITSSSATMEGLAAGSYTFKITDACGYARNFNWNLLAVSQDYPSNPYQDFFQEACSDTDTACNRVVVTRNGLFELSYYWESYGSEFYEVAFTVNGVMTEWMSPEYAMTVTLPYTYREIRDNDYVVDVHLRVKDCPGEYMNVDQVRINRSAFFHFQRDSAGCFEYNALFYPSGYELLCFPYRWELRDALNDTLVASADSIWNCQAQRVRGLSYNRFYSLIVTDRQGTVLRDSLFMHTTRPGMSAGLSVNYCLPDTFQAYYTFLCQSPDVNMNIPAGTRIRQTGGPMTVPCPDTVLATPLSHFYPFSTNPTQFEGYAPIPPGTYTFEVTMCDSTFTIEFDHGDYGVQDFTYVSEETCNGLYVYPLGTFLRNGDPQQTYYRLVSAPDGIPQSSINSISVDTANHSGYFVLPLSGHYVFILYKNSSACALDTLEIDYERQEFGLASYSVYTCYEGDIPKFDLKAQNGFPPYIYTLYENSVPVASNATGEFVYGNAANNYSMRITDACGTNFIVSLLIVNLGSTSQAVSGTDTICVGDTLFFSCIGLGATAFHWEGPPATGFSSDEQFVFIPNTTLAHTGPYVLTFQPPGCVSPVTQTLNVYVSPLPDLAFDASIADICYDRSPSLQLNGLRTDYTYAIYHDAELLSPAAEAVSGTTGATVLLADVLNADTTYYITATNPFGCTSAGAKPAPVHVITVSILSPDTLPFYHFNHPYMVQFVSDANGGVYTHTGVLPAGLSLNAAGLLSGTAPYTGDASPQPITVTVTDIHGCETSGSYLLQTCGLKPVVPQHEIAYCLNEMAAPLQASSPDGFPLYWYDATQTRLEGTPTPVTTSVGQQLYYVSQYNTTLQCEGPLDTIRVIVRPLPALNFDASAADICYRTSPAIRLELLRPDYTYSIYSDSLRTIPVATVTGVDATLTQLSDVLESDRNYYISVTDVFGCVSASAKKTGVHVIVLEILPEQLPPYRKFEPYEQQLTTNAASPLFSMPEGTLPQGLSLNASGRLYGVVPASAPCLSAPLTVQVEDAHGCTVRRSYNLYCEYFLPRVFTPNGDGINDIFMIGYRLVIFDRLGIVIFEGDNGWDGTHNGSPAPPDIYFYKIYVANEAGLPEIKTGYIGLERER
ncbi:MAG: gliding motility-associated C-terminal domain-containing protein [Prevotellaceae bacterium]|jgi:gliding motility-associated-like protein|nr:gliding motility-associated C-terminal domain-containing protein [Prevotellaceae bacterium]